MEAHCVPSEVRNISLYAIIQINFISQKSITALCISLRFSPHIYEKRTKNISTWATDNAGIWNEKPTDVTISNFIHVDGSVHVSDLQGHPQENSHSRSHNHWFSGCTVRAACSVGFGWSWWLFSTGHQDLPQHTEHAARTVQPLNQWLCEQLCEFSWGWACRPETCRDPSICE
jgi:hypothetical protein